MRSAFLAAILGLGLTGPLAQAQIKLKPPPETSPATDQVYRAALDINDWTRLAQLNEIELVGEGRKKDTDGTWTLTGRYHDVYLDILTDRCDGEGQCASSVFVASFGKQDQFNDAAILTFNRARYTRLIRFDSQELGLYMAYTLKGGVSEAHVNVMIAQFLAEIDEALAFKP